MDGDKISRFYSLLNNLITILCFYLITFMRFIVVKEDIRIVHAGVTRTDFGQLRHYRTLYSITVRSEMAYVV